MTTIVVVKKNGYNAIAADTMATLGDIKQPADLIENHQKILRVGASYVGITGHCAHQNVMQDYFSKAKQTPKFENPQSIFAFFRAFHAKLKDYYYINPKEEDDDEYESSQIHCLIANPYGVFGVYSFREVESYAKFFSFGSGREFALGALEAIYDRYDSAEEIARVAVETAAKYDNRTGLPVLSYEIRQKSGRGKVKR